jgi:large subunit ribosomal protein L1
MTHEMAKHGKTYLTPSSARPRARVQPAEAIALVKQLARRQVQRVGRGPRPHRPQRPPRRRAAARHDRAAQRPRQGRQGRGVRPGRQGREAEEAGADVVGAEDLAQTHPGGLRRLRRRDRDARPDAVVGRLGRILGPSGKMPNPKVGTVTMDVAKAVEESKAGKVEYRTDRTAIVHLVIGKATSRPPAARELRGRDRRADPRQAVRRQGPLHPLGHVRLDDGPRRQGRPTRTRDIVEERSSRAHKTGTGAQ